MADGIANLAASVQSSSDQGVGESLTIGALDEDANFYLKRELAERGIAHFDPAGTSLESTGSLKRKDRATTPLPTNIGVTECDLGGAGCWQWLCRRHLPRLLVARFHLRSY